MTAAPRPLAPADERLLDEIGRRFAAVDEELPRLQPWRSDRVAAGQLHVVRGRVRPATAPRPRAALRAGRIRPEVAGAAIAAALAVAILVASRGGDVGRPAAIALPTSPGPAFSLGPRPTDAPTSVPGTPAPTRPAPTPAPTRAITPRPSPLDPGGPAATPAPVAVTASTIQDLLDRTGWRCGVLMQVALDPLGSGLIDKLAFTAGQHDGYISGDFGPGWIGTDPMVAARAFKARPLVVDTAGSLWVLRSDGADGVILQIVPEQSRSGATAWRSADVLWPVTCPPPETDAKQLIAKRPASDWPVGTIVDLSVVRVSMLPTSGRRPQ